MRISTAVQIGMALTLAGAQPVQAQKSKKAAPKAAPAAPMAAAPASIAGRWAGSYTNDVTQKGGSLVITLNGTVESASGQLMLTPTGKGAVMPEGSMAMAAPTKGKAKAAPASSGGLPVTAMKSGDDKVSGSIEAPYVDPGCSCSVVSTFEGTLSGSTLTGTISARDSKTGQWNFSSFTVSKGGGGKR